MTHHWSGQVPRNHPGNSSPQGDHGFPLPMGLISPQTQVIAGNWGVGPVRWQPRLGFRQGHLGLVGIHRLSLGRDLLSWHQWTRLRRHQAEDHGHRDTKLSPNHPKPQQLHNNWEAGWIMKPSARWMGILSCQNFNDQPMLRFHIEVPSTMFTMLRSQRLHHWICTHCILKTFQDTVHLLEGAKF